MYECSGQQESDERLEAGPLGGSGGMLPKENLEI